MTEVKKVVYTTDDEAKKLVELYAMLMTDRPADRSQLDRFYSVMITDLEKLMAYHHTYIKIAKEQHDAKPGD